MSTAIKGYLYNASLMTLSNSEIANTPCVFNRKWSIIINQRTVYFSSHSRYRTIVNRNRDTPMREMGNWNEYFIEYLAADREAAIDYLQLTLEEYLADDDLPFFIKCLRTFIASQGGVVEICKRTGIDTETLLNMLSSEGNSQKIY